MQVRICPFCAGEIPLAVSLCIHCGKELRSMKIARPYEIVYDGLQYGIALGGEVKLHGLELKKAQELEALLNSVLRDEKAG